MGAKVQELSEFISSAQRGDLKAYDQLVIRFQDMAVAYAYSVLSDFHLAQDAAQEAFVEAFYCLPRLEEPLAFPSWLRRIVFKHCDRMTRKKQIQVLPLDAADVEVTLNDEPHQVLEQQEAALQVRRAVAALPEHERSVMVLFYMGQHSQNQIAEFLEVPVTTVKKRLHTARKRLKERMIDMVQDNLQEQRPSQGDEFRNRVQEMLGAVEKGDVATVDQLLQQDPSLINQKALYWSAGDEETVPLHVAAMFNQHQVAQLLLEAGADPHIGHEQNAVLSAAAFHRNRPLVDALLARGVEMDIFAASSLGDVEHVQSFLQKNPSLISAKDRTGATALHRAGTPEVARVLLDAGADIEAKDDLYHNTPAEYAVSHRDVVDYLISRGAQVRFHLACFMGDVRRVQEMLQLQPELAVTPNGNCRPEGNSMPMTIAIVSHQAHMVEFLLDHSVDVNAPDQGRGGATALHFAALWGQLDIVRLLIQRGADIAVTTHKGATPLNWAVRGEQEGWGKFGDSPNPPQHAEVIQLLKAADCDKQASEVRPVEQ
jgi:RNA polymerase sigma factor (sigma-70 family)